MSKPILYAYHMSAPSWRVRLALAHKKIPHDIRSVNWLKNETHTPEFLKICPAGQIPVLEVEPGNFIGESMAILEYIEEMYPQNPILPSDKFQRAKVREICEFIGTGIHPQHSKKLASRHSPQPAEQLQFINDNLNEGLSSLENILKGTTTSQRFCFKDFLSAADFVFIPQIYNAAERYKLSMTPYPIIWAIYKSLLELDIVQATHPRHILI